MLTWKKPSSFKLSRDMRKFRFLNVSKDKRNFVVGLLASNSKKPAINYLSSRIFFELDKDLKVVVKLFIVKFKQYKYLIKF